MRALVFSRNVHGCIVCLFSRGWKREMVYSHERKAKSRLVIKRSSGFYQALYFEIRSNLFYEIFIHTDHLSYRVISCLLLGNFMKSGSFSLLAIFVNKLICPTNPSAYKFYRLDVMPNTSRISFESFMILTTLSSIFNNSVPTSGSRE